MCYENAMAFHKDFWGYKPSEDVTILLNDFADIGNGGTMVIPWNMISVGISPFSYAYNIIPSNERFQWLMNHELAHVVMCDKAARNDELYRKIFLGKVMPDKTNPLSMVYSYMTTPRWYSPRWYHEGIAVFMETWMSGGLGRVLGGYDEMVFRTMVHDSSYFYRVIGLETEGSTIDFQVGVNAYLYGTRFVSYLAYHYGVDKLKEFYDRSDSSKRFYASQFQNVYGVHIKDEWERWITWEKNFQTINLETIRDYPVTPYEKLTDLTLGSVSNTFFDQDNNRIYAAVNYPGEMAHIASIDLNSGDMEKIGDVYSPQLYYVTSLAYDDSAKMLYMTTHNSDWRGLASIDIKTGKRENLVKITRTGELTFNNKDKSLWGVQHLNGRVTLVRFEPPYSEWDEVYTIEFGKSMFDIQISNDGNYLSAAVSDVAGNQKLILHEIDELLMGNTEYEVLYEFEDSPISHFVFSPDDKYMVGSSFYTGVSNIYRISIETRELELLTNAETGFFRPIPLSNDSLLVFQYHQNGLLPCKIGIEPIEDAHAVSFLGQMVYEKNPEVEEWMLAPPSSINLDSLKKDEGDYYAFQHLKLASAYPIVEGYKNLVAWGYRFNFMDMVGLHSLKLSALYSPYGFLPEDQRFHANLDYRLWGWTFNASYNKTDFYDLFGPTKVSRAGYAFTLKYYKKIKYFKPQIFDLYFLLGAYADLETLPEFQNVAAPYKNMYTGTFNLHYSFLRKSLGAIEPEQGFEWNFFFFNYLAGGDWYPKLISNQDIGFLIPPMRNTYLWLRTSVGQSFGERKNNLSNFYFGGFGNNYVDYREVHQYREFLNFPGFEIDEVAAMNYGKLMAELNLKPIRFKKAGFLGFYTTYTQLSLFGTGLFADIFDPDYKSIMYNAGAQLNFELVLFSLIKSTFSVGYSRGFRNHEAPNDQFMLSLKIL